jgi:hypothetical protein
MKIRMNLLIITVMMAFIACFRDFRPCVVAVILDEKYICYKYDAQVDYSLFNDENRNFIDFSGYRDCIVKFPSKEESEYRLRLLFDKISKPHSNYGGETEFIYTLGGKDYLVKVWLFKKQDSQSDTKVIDDELY